MAGERASDGLRSFVTAPLTEAEVVAWGRSVGRQVEPPLFVTLSGGLGAGKSVLARAIGVGAGVTGDMPSPTYNLVLRHEGRAGSAGVSVVHVDLYRLSGPEDLWEVGWSDLGGPGDIVLVEWPERAAEGMPPDRWDVELTPVPGAPAKRRLSVRALSAAPTPPPPPGDRL